MEHTGRAGKGRERSLVAVLVLGGVLLLASFVGLLLFAHFRHNPELPTMKNVRAADGLTGGLSAGPLGVALGLTQLGGKPAPGFTLTDQRGRSVSLAAFRGKVVVLEFMDPHCTDVCPIVSQEYVEAAHLLGRKLSQVAFVGVNVNQFAESRAAVLRFSREHRLTTLPNWYFVTGSTAQLRRVWRDYSVTVTPTKTGDVKHSSVMYFIGRRGRLRYLAFPDDNKAKIRTWAHGITTVARSLL
ncbi:MAG TPA: SCO family protein [Gaiellaceae bacterium]|jgi:cytochrome oxidase Cu insertion factor (SCO1/SenC/PrrC family)|nr:SCO family protein [Gaiellaceae bacterium]